MDITNQFFIDHVKKQIRLALRQSLKTQSSKDHVKQIVANTLANIPDVSAKVDVTQAPSKTRQVHISNRYVEANLAYVGSLVDDSSIILAVLQPVSDFDRVWCKTLSLNDDNDEEMRVQVKITVPSSLKIVSLDFYVQNKDSNI